jgi:methylmalonyl-CoA mutase
MLFHHTEPVTYLRLLKVTVIDETALTQEQVEKLYGVFKTIETVSGKFPLSQNQELMMPLLPTAIESEKKELSKIKFF